MSRQQRHRKAKLLRKKNTIKLPKNENKIMTTFAEKLLLEQVAALYATYDPDELTEEQINSFNEKLDSLLFQHDVSLERYHDLLLYEIEKKLELE